ncbi:MAG TPA: asparagine synthase C-terminal domain-containing protein, partial [Tepidisphaeraceae bacterium]|nr:asparagine synthase C-terminal domain-containing protein [Tepidisphaeraceae bacterium]
SGGVDSSAVAAIAVRSAASPRDIRTFNIAFEEAEFDESRYARQVAEALGTDHHEMCLTESRFVADLAGAMNSIDQPTFDAINTYMVSKLVKEAGITVALAGTGGDELFGGYKSFVDLPKYRNWARGLNCIPKSISRTLARRFIQWKTGSTGDMPPQTRWGKMIDAIETGGQLLEFYQVAYGLFTRDFADRLTENGLMSHTHAGLSSDRAENLRELIDGQENLHAVSLLELSLFLGDRLLRDTDAASMAVSLEVRVPLLDHEVVESIAGLQTDVRFAPLGRKQLLRKLAFSESMMPIFDRPKSGFVLPLDRWCRQGLKGEIAQTFNNAELCHRLGLNPDAIKLLWSGFESGAPGLYWSRIWALYVLLWWCEKHRVSMQ